VGTSLSDTDASTGCRVPILGGLERRRLHSGPVRPGQASCSLRVGPGSDSLWTGPDRSEPSTCSSIGRLSIRVRRPGLIGRRHGPALHSSECPGGWGAPGEGGTFGLEEETPGPGPRPGPGLRNKAVLRVYCLRKRQGRAVEDIEAECNTSCLSSRLSKTCIRGLLQTRPECLAANEE
jgi:hypothetical protein